MVDWTDKGHQAEAADLFGSDIAKIITAASTAREILAQHSGERSSMSPYLAEQLAVILGHALNPPDEPAAALDLDGPLDFTDDDRGDTGGHCFTSNEGECLNGFDWGGYGPDYNR
jgi:hypothetical protein